MKIKKYQADVMGETIEALRRVSKQTNRPMRNVIIQLIILADKDAEIRKKLGAP